MSSRENPILNNEGSFNEEEMEEQYKKIAGMVRECSSLKDEEKMKIIEWKASELKRKFIEVTKDEDVKSLGTYNEQEEFEDLKSLGTHEEQEEFEKIIHNIKVFFEEGSELIPSVELNKREYELDNIEDGMSYKEDEHSGIKFFSKGEIIVKKVFLKKIDWNDYTIYSKFRFIEKDEAGEILRESIKDDDRELEKITERRNKACEKLEELF